MKSPRTVAIAGIAALAMVGALAACSPGGGERQRQDRAPRRHLPARRRRRPPTTRSPSRRSSSRRRNPDIDIIGVEYEWEGPTFAVQLAGGSLPDVFTVPFTDSKTLLENGQLMDVTDEVDELGYADKFNPIILDG